MSKLNLTKLVFTVLTLQVLILSGCATAPEKLSSQDIKYAETKALIENKEKNDSNSASIDVFYHQDGSIRMEVSALLGYRVGSLLMTPKQITYAMHPQKVFVQGPFSARTLKPLFHQDIDPRLLWAVVFDRDLKNFGFNCQMEGVQKNCIGTAGIAEGVQVTIQPLGESPLQGDQPRKVVIENAKFKFVWVFKSIRKHNKSYNETFVLNQPEEYRLITIK